MSLLAQVVRGKRKAPPRVMLYGVHGIGKSTWPSSIPGVVYLETEEGTNEIDVPRFPLATSWEMVLSILSELYSETHEHSALVIDTLDWMEKLIHAEVCRKHNVSTIEDIGYGKGSVYALGYWRQLLEGLDALRTQKGMAIILLAHSTIQRFENPETEAYDRYTPRLEKKAAAVIQEWCDGVFFASYRTMTRSEDKGFNKKRVLGMSTGERVIRTEERPAHLAKNRWSLPLELPLSWDEFAKHLSN